ncbi:MgtC/SapB family protein [Brevundimonas sp. FT23042]|uniref:MgtC/SapB family protein n=1 Tax=Brevundimonas sp. FT23042 TaxID=3393749 RepID=UPI003B587C9A
MNWTALSSAMFPMGGAILAGAVIGLEREWRGRAAGLRTHILVSLASALLMLAAVSQADWAFRALPDQNVVTDPVRMAHGVLTGIGFLCAGVIFRAGFSIHGLTTAASLWITAAIGLLFGARLYEIGVAGVVATAAILAGLKVVGRMLPLSRIVDVEVSWSRLTDTPEHQIGTIMREIDPNARTDRRELRAQGDLQVRSWRLSTPDAHPLDALAARLSDLPGVTAFRIEPRDD